MNNKLFVFGAAVLVAACILGGCAQQNGPEPGPEPEPTPPEERELRDLPEDYAYKVLESDYEITYGDVTIHGKLYEPDDTGKFPAVILSHGFNGTGNDFVQECRQFARRGYVAYALDFAGGSNASKSTGRATTELTLDTMKEDLKAVIAKIKTFRNVDKTQIFLFGGSQGGLVTALTAADLADEIANLVLWFPAINIPDDWRKTFPDESAIPETYEPYNWGLTLGKVYFTSMRELDPFTVIGAFKKDVLILWGDADTIVPRSYMDRAVEVYDHASLSVIKGQGHGFAGAGKTDAIAQSLAFMEQHTYKSI